MLAQGESIITVHTISVVAYKSQYLAIPSSSALVVAICIVSPHYSTEMASKFSCLFLLLTFHLVVAYDRWALFQQVMIQAGTCVGSGYPLGGGCCQGPNCSSLDGSCYCDRLCHTWDDCCTDIDDIECSASMPTKPPPPPPTTCTAAGFTNGCCVPNGSTSCHVPAGNCSCNRLCYHHNNCCSDIADINCPAPPPTNCATLRAGFPSGCCSGSNCNVYNITQLSFCSCGLGCYTSSSTTETECCDDIASIGCYPQTCQQAGHTSCCDPNTDPNDCRVHKGNNSYCYCDDRCNNNMGNHDCCPDAATICSTPSVELPPSPLMLRQLADLMSNSPSRDWSKQRVASLWRRYQASLLAQIQYRERPKNYFQGN